MKIVHARVGWVLLMFACLSGCIISPGNENDYDDDPFEFLSFQYNDTGYLNESERSEVVVPTNMGGTVTIVQINVSLTWVDEPVIGPLINEPDIFSLDILIENTNISGEENSSGRIDINWKNDDLISIREIRLVITCNHSGDIYYPGLIKREDDHGNEYSMEYQFDYMS
jgi:hypothetical protein